MRVGTIKEIWRYPVKTLGGERIENALIQPRGIADDRCWYIRDELTHEIITGRKIPGLMMLRARCVDALNQQFDQPVSGLLEIAFPDGQTVQSNDPYLHAMLSMHLGRRVSLVSRPNRKDKAAYRLAKPMTPAEVRYVLGMKPTDPDPDFSSFSLKMLTTLARYATPPGVLYDVYPLHVLTTAALDWIGQFYPEGDFSVRRYRPNFLIETDPQLEGIVENDWRGRILRIGALQIQCNHPTIRCSMPGAAQPGLPKDPNIPLVLMKHAAQHLGAYCTPINQAEIHVGDVVELLPASQGKLFFWFDEVGRAVKSKVLKVNNLVSSQLLRKAPNQGKAALPQGFEACKVVSRQAESEDVVSIRLARSDASPMPRFMPGQHLLVAIPLADGGYTYRPYTISSSPNQLGHYRISVKLKTDTTGSAGNASEFGQASGYLHHTLREGDHLWIKAPGGQFAVHPADKSPLVLISAGVGITPFLSILNALAEENPSRPVHLIHGLRRASKRPFASELAALEKRLPNLQVQLWISGGAGDHVAGHHTGRIDLRQALQQIGLVRQSQFMICGTPEFSKAMFEGVLGQGIGAQQVRTESFGASQIGVLEDSITLQVYFSQSKRKAAWQVSGESLLGLAEAEGIEVSSGCRYGACQACEATLISGEVAYPEGVLPPAGKNKVLLCSARPVSDLEIDL